MCELFALSSSEPSKLTHSLRILADRGGEPGQSNDGWGVAFYQGEDVALFREPSAASNSALLGYLESQGPSTKLAISHIRHATQGSVQLANTQPFVRELGGRMHVFAHNGDLPNVESAAAISLGNYRPVGQTDSEYVFCALLARLFVLWKDEDPPSLQARMSVLSAFASDIRAVGPANFIYADGDALFVHAHRRLQASGRAEPPGLWFLQVQSVPNEPLLGRIGGGISKNQVKCSAMLVASVPLTDDSWQPMVEGELIAIRAGELLERWIPPGP